MREVLTMRQRSILEALRADHRGRTVRRAATIGSKAHASALYDRIAARVHLDALARLLADRAGVILVEFALVGPVLCLLIIGGIDIGLAQMQAGAAQSGLAVGGSYLTGRSDAAGVEAVVKQSSNLLGNATVEAVTTGTAVHLTVTQPIYSSGMVPGMPASITASGVFVLKS